MSQTNEKAIIAHNILTALLESSWADELMCYWEEVQEDLGLTDTQMADVFSLSKICEYLKPVPPVEKKYKGRPIKKGTKVKFSSVLDDQKRSEELNKVLGGFDWVCTGDVCQLIPNPPSVPCESHNTDERVNGVCGSPVKPFDCPVVFPTEVPDENKEVKQERPEIPVIQLPERVVEQVEPVVEQKVEQVYPQTISVVEPVVEQVADQKVQQVAEPTERSSSDEGTGQVKTFPNKDENAKYLRKLFRKNGIPVYFEMNTEMYEKAIIVSGEGIEEFRESMEALGGKWNKKLSGMVFKKTYFEDA